MAVLAFAIALAALQEEAASPSTPPASPSSLGAGVPQASAEIPSIPEASPPVEIEPSAAPARFVPAAVEEPAPSRKLADRPESGPSLGGFVLGSSIVIALLLGAFLLFKRFARNSRFLGAGGPIRVLARKGLGARHDLFLVEVGPRVFLLGATRDRLGTLGEFRSPDEVAALRADRPEGTFRESFRESLQEGIRAEEKPAPDGVYASISEELAEIGRTVRAWKA